ncbi:hypothetical protein JOL79_02145 [Microbispora sp. RL4-1S]|uniref:Uncharacterized protein n=1 Tax=Microbispora oryzae TaxID=2806554 RepID=A0A940WEC7_9ACTN|nr:hypothetical protein [Microbispora oryzae]MBP2702602.1 hypothetical protein [Microbispora oryzae]
MDRSRAADRHLRLPPYLRRIADRDLLKIDNAESAAAHLPRPMGTSGS